MAFRHILVATDFSEASGPALRLAVEMAREGGCDLTVQHTCEVPFYAYTELAMSPVDLLEPVVEVARRKLADVVAGVHGRCPGAHAVLKVGVPWEQILAAAREAGADLLVVGTHGRHGVTHALLGSVAEKVVRLSPVPVLTVRAPPTAG
ncbi:MAG TPA: universal stress protein [Anaeromyxobacteraceae bacterium]|nr:universal stress protein [Anaeromyxobacteraceae bacterium]